MTDTTAYSRQEITLDQQVALHTAATRLAEEFDGAYGTETIEKFLHTSYDQFATAAPPASTWATCARSGMSSSAESDDSSTT
ncbi:hypothetical protein AB0C02_31445 [Micromonospora sp. NPDC048999]|uniref:three-helix bundle dimerization domain-containing protein n=1 Tax=Micromonospora sp. NPDC048999 TaxID=3155391 RepID=UPI0033EDC023